MAQVIEDNLQGDLQAGRDAFKRRDWNNAYDHLGKADSAEALAGEDLERLAEAAWWTGHPDESKQAHKRAFDAYRESQDKLGAARTAMRLGWWHLDRLAPAIGYGWLTQAEEILAEVPESSEHGWLAEARAFLAINMGNLDEAVELAEKSLSLGRKFKDTNLEALSRTILARALIMRARVEEGNKMLDRSLASADNGELDAHTTGVVYCSTIATCSQLADYERAAVWTEVADRWCNNQSITGFPGLCRVHRAEIMRQRGDWEDAEKEAQLACEQLEKYFKFAVGWGQYEIGEVRLRQGDLAGAEEAFKRAHEFGKPPQPGLSLLQLASGKVDSAARSIRRALEDGELQRLERVRQLPAAVEIALAAGDLEWAAQAAEEIEKVAEDFGSKALSAHAKTCRGRLLLAQGSPAEAERALTQALKIWNEIDIPYDAARVRTYLAEAYRQLGDEDAMALELGSARSTFERLGALPDARRAAELLERSQAAEVSAARTTRTFMFTDIVKSTNLVEAIGDQAWGHLLRWHDARLRSLFAEHSGEEINRIGDGFFVSFETPKAAFDCAAAIQRALAEHRREHGFAPEVRIGLHSGEATRQGYDYQGRAIHEAARIGALAAAGEILATSASVPAEAQSLASEPRLVSLKGISEPVEVVAIAWR